MPANTLLANDSDIGGRCFTLENKADAASQGLQFFPAGGSDILAGDPDSEG